jgi:hypothetical protein
MTAVAIVPTVILLRAERAARAASGPDEVQAREKVLEAAAA